MTREPGTGTQALTSASHLLGRFPIRFRIAALTSLVIAVITAFMFAYFPARQRDQALAALAERARSVGELAAFSVSAGLIFDDAQTVSEVMEGLSRSKDLAYVVVEKDDGDVFASHGADRAAGAAYWETSAAGSVLSDFSMYRVLIPVTFNSESVGAVYLGFELASLEEAIALSRRRIALVSLVVLTVGVVLAYLVGTVVTQPLRMMVATISAISKGDLSLRASVLARDEVGALAVSFNRMVDTVEERTSQLRVRVSHEKAVGLLGRKAVTANDARTVMQLAAEAIVSNVSVDCCDILEYEPGGVPVLKVRAGARTDTGVVEHYEVPLDAADKADGVSLERTVEAAAVERHQAENARCIPIPGHDMPVGAIAVACTTPCEFHAGELEFIEGVAGILGQAIERCNAESALRISERMHRAMIEAVPDGVLRLSENGTVIDCRIPSDAGAIAAENPVVGDRVDDFFPEKDRELLRQLVTRAVAGESVRPFEYSFEDGGGSQFREARFVSYVQGEVLGLIRDITQRVTAEQDRNDLEQQMRHAEKLKSLGVLAGGIAHDFNNLLMGIQFNAGMLKEESMPGSRPHSLGEQIEAASDRAAELTNQMLAYSGEGRFEIRPLRFDELVRNMAKLLFASISKKVVVEYELSPDTPSVRADSAQMHQVAMNLIINAADAIGDAEGTIRVRSGRVELCGDESFDVGDTEVCPGTYSYLEVEDTGCGMDAETRAQIFDPFFTTKFTGRGLGLGAVQGIVRGHGGFLAVASEPGIGTTFRMLLPESDVEDELTPGAVDGLEASEWVREGTVLVVDDEQMIRELVLDIGEQLGYTVLTASDGVAGLEQFKAHSEEIVLTVLDMTMPRLGGLEVLREIKQIDPEAVVILSSGFNERVARAESQDLVPAGFLKKPYGPVEFRKKIQEVMATR